MLSFDTLPATLEPLFFNLFSILLFFCDTEHDHDVLTHHNSEERWRSEGIQVGGIRSGRGVLGNWFDKDFDRHGPAGPTAFWKVSDYIEDKDAEEGAADDASLGDDDSDGDTEYMSD